MTRPLDETGGPLGVLVMQVLERLDLEGPGALDEACREHPQLAGALRRRMAALADLGLVQLRGAGKQPDRIGDFRLIEKVGSGGMGVVFRAEQLSLGREVALKLIRPDSLHLDDARERFARETAIVAKLSHPGIVPIHVVGDDDEQVPYYAMEYVPGCTLAEALDVVEDRPPDSLRGADLWRAVLEASRRAAGRAEPQPAPPGAGSEPGELFAGSWEDACLRVVGQVSEALEHAHARGVLHRDLKPSNVMITPGGRVMLMDFGLSQSEGADSMTRSGARIGSIPYMAPELLRDGPAVLDRRSDIYGLGVTLYEMLTLRLPYGGASVPAVMAAIGEGRPPRPRAYNPGLSWEAETVCLAAFDRAPERRYASAAGLTRDLSNALHRLPVEARRASFALRARRWVERRPGEALAAVLLVLLPTVAALLLSREARSVRAAYAVAQTNRDRALRSIDAMLVRVSDEALDGVPGMLGLRGELLAEAAELYDELLREVPEDLEAVLLAVRCEHLWNRLLRNDGKYTEAEQLGRRALARMTPWPLDSGPLALRRLRAAVLDDLKYAVRLQERHAEAAHFGAQAIEVLRSVLRDEPDDLEAQADLLLMISDQIEGLNLAGELGESGQPGGVDTLQESVAGLRALMLEHGNQALESSLANALKALAHGLSLSGRHHEAQQVLEELLELLRTMLEAHPDDEQVRFKLAQTASLLAGEMVEQHHSEAALEPLALAAGEIERVRDDFPGVAEFEYLAGHVAANRAAAYSNLARYEDARAAAEEGMEIVGALHERFPENAEYTRTLGTIVLGVAVPQAALGEPEAALESCDFAQSLFATALEARPNSDEWRKWLAITEYSRAKALIAMGLYGDAADALLRTVAGAGRRTDVAIRGLERLVVCLQEARENADDLELTRCRQAAASAVQLAQERGDLDQEESLHTLRQAAEE